MRRVILALLLLCSPAFADEFDEVCLRNSGLVSGNLVASDAQHCLVNATPQPTFAYTPPTPVPTATLVPTATPQPTATPVTYRSYWLSDTGNNNASSVATQYMNVSGSQAANNSESTVDNYTHAATISRLLCNILAAPGATASWAITFRVNAGDTALTCTINDPDTSCHDHVHSVAVSDHDAIAYKIVPTNTPANTPFHCTIEVNIQ